MARHLLFDLSCADGLKAALAKVPYPGDGPSGIRLLRTGSTSAGCAGGLVTSTLFTLFALPTFYQRVHQMQERWRGDRMDREEKAA